MTDLEVLRNMHDKYHALYVEFAQKYDESYDNWDKATRDDCKVIVDSLWKAMVYIEGLDVDLLRDSSYNLGEQ